MTSYAEVLTEATTLSGSPNPAMQYASANADTAKMHDAQAIKMTFKPANSENVILTGLMQVTLPLKLTQAFTVAEVDSHLRQTFGISTDRVRITATDHEITIYGLTHSDVVKLAAALRLGEPVQLTDTVHASSSLIVAFGAAILERLKIGNVPNVLAKYGVTFSEIVTLSSSLGRMFGGALAETMRLQGIVIPQYQGVQTVQEHSIIGEALGNSLLMSVTLTGGVTLTDADILKAIYRGDTLLDGVVITAGYVAPSGEFTTWTINTRTNAVSEYQNWTFNSFAKIGRKYIGANARGLYELDGVDDDGASISTYIASGLFQLNGSRYTAFKAAYLGMRTRDDEQIFLKLMDGRGNEFVYGVTPQDMHSTRVNFGKGLRSRYFGWALQTVAADFDLDSVTFVPLFSQRRVG